MNNNAHISLELGKVEQYEASSSVWAMRKADDIVHGINMRLSNMFSGFPFEAAGTTWKDSERLYLCGEFSLEGDHYTDIQRQLIANTSGYAAKRFTKSKYKKEVREDFGEFRLQWMLWCVWQKCQNHDFQKLLLSIPDDVIIVENTTYDNGGTAQVWGCRNKELCELRKQEEKKIISYNPHLSKKALKRLISVEINKIDSIGTWEGQNNIGKILMICRHALRTGIAPTIDYDLLRSKHIHVLGKELKF